VTVGDTVVETYSGRWVDVYDPQPETICLEDIAHALANTARYGGHTRHFYSVAEHAVYVSRRLERLTNHKELWFVGLHHDDAEAYLCDIPRPLKPLLGPEYAELTKKMDAAIFTAIHIPCVLEDPLDYEVIKDADNWALFVEARHLLPSKGKKWNLQPNYRIVTPTWFEGGMKPKKAEREFLARHHYLRGVLDDTADAA